ncbi:MAG: helix-turn-helix domain-containing protein, partial [Pseudanabaena sp. ELA748]
MVSGYPKSMAVKLALDDKQEILRLYRESDASTTQLAKQFGISTSTVLRLLQELIPTEEYRQLVSQKKAEGKRGCCVQKWAIYSFIDRGASIILGSTRMHICDSEAGYSQSLLCALNNIYAVECFVIDITSI